LGVGPTFTPLYLGNGSEPWKFVSK
jgi:hypothetical protein